MSNRRKIKPKPPRRGSGSSTFSTGADDDAFAAFLGAASQGGFSAMARKNCSQCGAAVRWVDETAATAHGLDVDQVRRFHGAGAGVELEYWVCTGCDNAGAFGPTQFS